ncbi:unnamed protein product [Pylaiella littoralis]
MLPRFSCGSVHNHERTYHVSLFGHSRIWNLESKRQIAVWPSSSCCNCFAPTTEDCLVKALTKDTFELRGFGDVSAFEMLCFHVFLTFRFLGLLVSNRMFQFSGSCFEHIFWMGEWTCSEVFRKIPFTPDISRDIDMLFQCSSLNNISTLLRAGGMLDVLAAACDRLFNWLQFYGDHRSGTFWIDAGGYVFRMMS